jgi:single-stranded DNA-binding protein
MNSVHLFGKVAEKPEVVRTRVDGRLLVVIKILTPHTWRDKSGKRQERVDSNTVTCWGGAAEVAARDVQPGDLIGIDGMVHDTSYVDRSTGRIKWTKKITATKLHLPDTDKFYEFFEQECLPEDEESTSTSVPLKSVP